MTPAGCWVCVSLLVPAGGCVRVLLVIGALMCYVSVCKSVSSSERQGAGSVGASYMGQEVVGMESEQQSGREHSTLLC